MFNLWDKRSLCTGVISILRADRLIQSRCEGYDIHVICEFPDVFPEEILDLSPVRKIDFATELVSGATLISKTLYCKATAGLRMLETQLHDRLDRGFVKPTVSPWGFLHRLFCEKEG